MEDNQEKIEGRDYVVCKICGVKSGRLYGKHLQSHGITSKEYKNKYPDALLTPLKDKEKTSKNSGKHMKQEKYKKMFSEKFKGDKNPNHKTKTTKKERKERSPFSKDFLYHETEEERQKFIKNALKNRKHTTRLDYYIEQGFDEETSEKMLKERQTTFSLDICIQKYGEKEGRKIWKSRQAKWQQQLLVGGNLKCGYSKVSQDLFYVLLKYYENVDEKKDIYFATKNQEYFISKKGTDKDPRIFVQYDFCDRKNKKIIEYNGDEYHANPKKYKSTDNPHPFRKWITSQEIWDKDSEKIRIANEEGFEVLTIWDSEYKKKKEETIEKCRDFLCI